MHGGKINPDLVQSKLFFELVIEAFICVDEVKETEKFTYDIEKEIDRNKTYVVRWAKWQGRLDQRSGEVESQNAIDMKMTDIWEEKCLPGRRALGAMR